MASRGRALSVTFPKPMSEFIEERVREGGFTGPDEYLRHLVRQDYERESEALRALVEEGLASGPGIEMTPARRAAMRERLIAKRTRRKRSA